MRLYVLDLVGFGLQRGMFGPGVLWGRVGGAELRSVVFFCVFLFVVSSP